MAEKVGIKPETTLLFKSFSVTVMVDVAVPSATTVVVPVIVEFSATAVPEVNTTLVPALMTGVSIDRTFVSATIELKVQVAIPEESVAEQSP